MRNGMKPGEVRACLAKMRAGPPRRSSCYWNPKEGEAILELL